MLNPITLREGSRSLKAYSSLTSHGLSASIT